ncbi:retrovirus-related pol polyprotein from transposon TNT 1-94, partial [Tanacetum coccineum]
KARFETYVNSKDIDLWQVIQNGDFYFEVEDKETKLMKETPYELLKDNEKKQLGKNEEAKITIYNALPCKEYERFSISNEETIDSGFTRFNAIVTSLKSLDLDYSSKNHVRKYLRAFPLKWRAKVIAIEEAKDLATLSLDELIENLKVYEMVLDNDGVVSKTTKENVKSLAIKAKVTREQTSDDSDSQGESDKEVDEEEAKAFNLLARNFQKVLPQGNKDGESSKPKGECYNCGIKGYFASECRKPKENKAFVGGSWSDSGDGDEQLNDETCLMDIASQEVCLKCDLLPDDWIMDSGCTKHMTGNRRLFTSYKEYDDGHVVFGSNLSLLKPKPSYLVEDDKINEPESQDLNGSLSLQVNVSDEGYPKSLKEARDHPITQVIVELNERTLRYYFDTPTLTLYFRMYGHGYAWNLRKLGRVLNVSSKGTLFFTKSTDTKGFMKHKNYHPNVLLSNMFTEIEARESLPIIVRLSGLDYNNDAFPYARIMTTLFDYLKNKHPNDASRMIDVEEVSPMCSPFTMESLELRNVLNLNKTLLVISM